MSLHVVLYQPQIPANTGNIARTCAGTLATLHLIRPLGFSTDDKMLKRAGLDYWANVDIRYHDSLEAFTESTKKEEGCRIFPIETAGSRPLSAGNFSEPDDACYFVFGRETTGLPECFLDLHRRNCLRLPQSEHIRSLNLSNTVAVVLYEALRQQGYPGLS